MSNLTAKQVSKRSTYELEERLSCMNRISSLLDMYRHVIEADEKIGKMIKSELENLINELEYREEL